MARNPRASVREYDRVEDLLEDRLRRRVERFEVSEVADSADVDEQAAREVLEHFAERYAYFGRVSGGVYRARLPAEGQERLV